MTARAELFAAAEETLFSPARADLALAQESLQFAQGRYEASAAPLLEVIDAQTALVQGEVTLSRAEFDELAAVFALRHALGRSLVDGAI